MIKLFKSLIITPIFFRSFFGETNCPCQDDGIFKQSCQKGYDIIYPNEVKKTLGCLCICPGHIKMDYPYEQPETYIWYRKFMGFFLGNSLQRNSFLKMGGIGYYFAEDNATLPIETLKALAAIRQPLLSHAMEITSIEMADYTIFSPDFHFISYLGYEDTIRDLDKQDRILSLREPIVFWRGSPTGLLRSDDATGLSQLQRTAICLEAKNLSWTDFKFSNSFSPEMTSFFNISGIWVNEGYGKISDLDWIKHRGVLDVDGNVNAWGLYWRLASYSVVFKVESNWTNAYIKNMIPWVHYVPIFRNLSNLENVTRMVTSDDPSMLEFLSKIAQNARKLADEHTYEKEVDRVARELTAIFSLSDEVLVTDPVEVITNSSSASSFTSSSSSFSLSEASMPASHSEHDGGAHDLAESSTFQHMSAWHHHLTLVLAQLAHTDRVKHIIARETTHVSPSTSSATQNDVNSSPTSSASIATATVRWNQSDFEHHFHHLLKSISPAHCSRLHGTCGLYHRLGSAAASVSMPTPPSSPATSDGNKSCHTFPNDSGLPLYRRNTTDITSSSNSSSSSSSSRSSTEMQHSLRDEFNADVNCTARNSQAAEKRNVILAVSEKCDCSSISFFVKNLRSRFSGAEVIIFCLGTSSIPSSHTDAITSSSTPHTVTTVPTVPRCTEEGIDSCGDVVVLGGEGFPAVTQDVAGIFLVLRWLHRRMHRKNFCTHILLLLCDLHGTLFQTDPFDFLDKTGAQLVLLEEEVAFREGSATGSGDNAAFRGGSVTGSGGTASMGSNDNTVGRKEALVLGIEEISRQLFRPHTHSLHRTSSSSSSSSSTSTTTAERPASLRARLLPGIDSFATRSLNGSDIPTYSKNQRRLTDDPDCMLQRVRAQPLLNPDVILGTFEGMLKFLDAVSYISNMLEFKPMPKAAATATATADATPSLPSQTINREALIHYVFYGGISASAGVDSLLLPASVAFAAHDNSKIFHTSLRNSTKPFHPLDNPILNTVGVPFSFLFERPLGSAAAATANIGGVGEGIADTAIKYWRDHTRSEALFCDLYPIERRRRR